MNIGTHIGTIEMNGTISNVARYFSRSVAESMYNIGIIAKLKLTSNVYSSIQHTEIVVAFLCFQ